MHRVLIANRGEIAVRIIRACREARLETVAVYSDADAASPHVVLADRAERVGPAGAAESYLSITNVIEAARRAGADAVHPGYGFLAENAAFAAACLDAGVIFIGPPPDVIAAMGSKTAARAMMRRAGVPVVPGVEPDEQNDDSLIAAAAGVGFPLLVKAAAGGGGKGMRTVRDPGAIREAIGAARREATAAFGDGRLYIERLVDRPRHVEFQIVADNHGRVVHLCERECSVQRRHQKVIEETPSPALTAALRARMGAAAVAAAEASGYRNAGTIEFLLEGTGEDARFYFLEMNTRLQVEHPITEAVTGIDLVRLQLAIADGAPLPFEQHDVEQRGHAVECRVYAEDPANGFLPQAGPLLVYREPHGPGIRVDGGVFEGGEIPVHYDPLLAKLIAHAGSREAATRRAVEALRRFPILGVRSNAGFLRRILEHPQFISGDVDTGFLDRELPSLIPPPSDGDAALAALVASVAHDRGGARTPEARTNVNPWTALTGWRETSA